MSIRNMLIATTAFALIFSLSTMNWAVALFLGACLTFIVIACYRAPTVPSRFAKRAALLLVIFAIYVLSVGPAMSVSQFQLNYDHPSTGPWDTTTVRTLFPLQAVSIKNVTMAGAPNGDYLVFDLVADYTWRWRNVGWSARAFYDALLP